MSLSPLRQLLLAAPLCLGLVASGCLPGSNTPMPSDLADPADPDPTPPPAPADDDPPDLAPVDVDLAPALTPILSVTSPVQGGKVILRTASTMQVPFTVTNARMCSDADPSCHRVCVKIDGDACNAPMKPCNVSGSTGPLTADLSSCPAASRLGVHTMTVSLQNGLRQAVLDSNGQPIVATAAFTAVDIPTLSVATPSAGATVTPNATTGIAAVTVNLAGFNLAAAGACMAGDQACGRVCLKIDGDACNAPMKPCNVAGAAPGALNANFKQCPKPTGPHAITVHLVDDAGMPVLNAAGTLPIQSVIAVTTN